MRPFKPEPEKAKSSGFLGTLKKGAKALGKDAAKAAKKAAQSPDSGSLGGLEPASGMKPGEMLTVNYRSSDDSWLVENPSGSTLRKTDTKQAAINEARAKVAGSEKYSQYQVLNRNPSGPDDLIQETKEFKGREETEASGPALPGFGAPPQGEGGNNGGQPFVPDMGMGDSTEPDDDDAQPYVPETLFDR